MHAHTQILFPVSFGNSHHEVHFEKQEYPPKRSTPYLEVVHLMLLQGLTQAKTKQLNAFDFNG